MNNEMDKILLRETDVKSYGANLSNIINLERKVQNMSSKRLVVFYNGEEQEPIDCQQLSISITDEGVVLTINTQENAETFTPTVDSAPQTQPVVPTSAEEQFYLTGDDLESFERISEFRREPNQIKELPEDAERKKVIITSETYNIQDLNSVEYARMDLLNAEQEYINEGYKIFEYSTPKYEYETDGEQFKLTESAVLCKSIVQPEHSEK